jgi:hypothetical protein
MNACIPLSLARFEKINRHTSFERSPIRSNCHLPFCLQQSVERLERMALPPRSSLRPLVLLMSHGKPRLRSFFSSSPAAVPPPGNCAPAAPAVQPPAAPGKLKCFLHAGGILFCCRFPFSANDFWLTDTPPLRCSSATQSGSPAP